MCIKFKSNPIDSYIKTNRNLTEGLTIVGQQNCAGIPKYKNNTFSLLLNYYLFYIKFSDFFSDKKTKQN